MNGFMDDAVDRSGFAEKSAAAQRREDASKSKFDEMRIATEDGGIKVTIKLLDPSAHLTAPCWSVFSKHVRSYTGWSVKRRVASDEEKRASHQTRQAKCYFVDVTYKPQSETKAGATGPPSKKQKSTKI